MRTKARRPRRSWPSLRKTFRIFSTGRRTSAPTLTHTASGRSARWAHRRARWLFPAPAVLFVAGLIVYPIAYTGWMSLQEWFVSSVTPPRFIGLADYWKILFGGHRFRQAVTRTVSFSVLR